MLDKKLLQLIDDTGETLELDTSLIEKDYFVTQIIHTLSNTETEYFRLVFAGGTCLAKAYKIVKRMSEDVDFKIQTKERSGNLSKTQFLKELKQFRLEIISKLTVSDFATISANNIRNEGKYFWIELNYPSSFPLNTSLRSHILLEFTLSNIHLPLKQLPIKTLIEETFDTITLFESFFTSCISVDETAIEKWVGLTRRIIAIERARHDDDKTLIRHVYDLNAIKNTNEISTNFFTLAKAIISNDAKQFKNQHPEYATDPSNEIRQSVMLLKNKSLWKQRYQEFIEEMVYDKTSALAYEDAINNLEHMSSQVIDSLF